MNHKVKLIFHIGHSAGFYSEFNNMVLAMLYCQRHNIEFQLYSADANFGIQNGWTDFFVPFCKETRNPAHHYINHRFDVPIGGKRKILYDLYKFVNPTNMLTAELWNDFRHIDQTELSTTEVQKQSLSIINEIYKFNNNTQQHIDKLINSIELPDQYIGIHLRGGDKKTEHDIVPVETYMQRAYELSTIRTAFISTDDYRYIEELQNKFPEWTIRTLTPKEDHGYYYNDFIALESEKKYKNLITMFASIELLCRADITLCTFSSNIGMFLGMRMGDRAIGVDMKNWMIW